MSTTNRTVLFWKDFFTALPGETKKSTIALGDTIGQTAGAIVQPTANAISKPLIAAAVIAIGTGVVYFAFKFKGGK